MEARAAVDRKYILIAVDGSPQSMNAVKYVAVNWAPAGLKVSLMHVLFKAPDPFWDLEQYDFFRERMKEKHAQWMKKTREAAQEFLGEASSILRKAGIPENDVRPILVERKTGISRDIIAESVGGYDAVVLGRSGLGDFEAPFLGTTSTRLIERCRDLAVWVVGGEMRSRKMLLAVDASENSRRAVAYAARFAAPAGAEVTLFHVVRTFGRKFQELYSLHDKDVEEFLEQTKEAMRKVFEACRGMLEKAGVPGTSISTKYALMQGKSRSGDILQEARAGGYGTIVMGRKGLSDVREFLMGRVTDKVLKRGADLAVWVIP